MDIIEKLSIDGVCVNLFYCCHIALANQEICYYSMWEFYVVCLTKNILNLYVRALS